MKISISSKTFSIYLNHRDCKTMRITAHSKVELKTYINNKGETMLRISPDGKSANVPAMQNVLTGCEEYPIVIRDIRVGCELAQSWGYFQGSTAYPNLLGQSAFSVSKPQHPLPVRRYVHDEDSVTPYLVSKQHAIQNGAALINFVYEETPPVEETPDTPEPVNLTPPQPVAVIAAPIKPLRFIVHELEFIAQVKNGAVDVALVGEA